MPLLKVDIRSIIQHYIYIYIINEFNSIGLNGNLNPIKWYDKIYEIEQGLKTV